MIELGCCRFISRLSGSSMLWGDISFCFSSYSHLSPAQVEACRAGRSVFGFRRDARVVHSFFGFDIIRSNSRYARHTRNPPLKGAEQLGKRAATSQEKRYRRCAVALFVHNTPLPILWLYYSFIAQSGSGSGSSESGDAMALLLLLLLPLPHRPPPPTTTGWFSSPRGTATRSPR